MTPSAIALVLNDYLSRMTDAIFTFEGTLDKYIGDAIMAVFGAPLDMPDHCVRAIKAALEMRDQLESFNLVLQTKLTSDEKHALYAFLLTL